HTPGSDRRSCSRSCGRCQTPCRAPTSPRQLSWQVTNCSLSSIAEHSFQGISTPSPEGESVTHVSGTMCHLCVKVAQDLFLIGVTPPLACQSVRRFCNPCNPTQSPDPRVQPIPSCTHPPLATARRTCQ